jgi:hypothetical protein
VLSRARRAALTLTAAATLVAGAALPAAAVNVSTTSSERVLGDLQHDKIRIRLDDGRTARGDVLRFREDDPALELRPRLAQRRVHGLQTVPSMSNQELGRGAVAGTNGGYWISRRSGNPNGLHVQDGRMVGSNASASGGGHRNRSALGITTSGQLLLDQVTTDTTATLPNGHRVGVSFMNRRVHATGDVVVYDDRYGDSVHVPPGGVYVQTEGARLRSGGSTTGTVTRVETPSEDRYFTLAQGQGAIVASTALNRESDRAALAALRRGDQVSLATGVRSTNGGGTWPADLAGALPAGGTLLRSGQIPPQSEWTGEAFTVSHVAGRHPRTAIGRTSAGEVLLVTIDGRDSDWSVGLSYQELARTMVRLGARDAVNLDGGGSTTMMRNNRVTNRPSERNRSVASGLFIHAETPPDPRSLGSACPSGQYPRDRFSDISAGAHGASVDCLAWWDVTQGTGDGRYSPANPVTRAQMASFLARFLDGAAERGSANGLPAEGSTRFDDVSGGPHAESISRLADVGIIQGRGDGGYDPSGNVTRDQMASFIRRAIEHATGSPLPEARDTFADDNGSTHEDSIDRLAGVGVISGVGGFDYRPRADVRRDAMASLVMRGADFLVTEGRTAPPG